MTDFSFVSVEVGIPFATSEGALTIYDCNYASRYVVTIGCVCVNETFTLLVTLSVVESVC